MIISDLSIKRPVFAAVLMLSLVTLGIFSYRRLSVEEFPSVEIPIVSVVTKYPGASPETVEREVSKRIEEAVNQVAGIKHVLSFSRDSVSTVVAEFRLEEKLADVTQEARAKVASIRGDLPTGVEEPIIQKFDFNAMPVASLAVRSASLSPRELTTLVEKKVKKRFESVPGVGKVDLVGGRKREVSVEVDPARLDALGLGVNEVVAGLAGENTNRPLGRLTRGGVEYPLRVEGKPEETSGYRGMVIVHHGVRPISLGEVARVIDGEEEPRKLALADGTPAIGFDIYKQSGANLVAVVENVKKVVEKVRADLPEGVTVEMVRDASVMTRESLADVQETLVIGGILTVIIVFCFINSWRSTVITGVTLPISVISAFIIMNALVMTLNVMTLMALSLAIGLLIDDAIVVRENIVRHLEHGRDHMEASRFGTNEIGLAVFATTMSILAVFVPVAYMRGIVGRFFYQFGITVSFAVLVSLLVSFTLDPMLSSRWHDPSIHAHGRRKGLARLLEWFNDWFDRTADGYRAAIGWALSHRKSMVLVSIVTFAAGVYLFGTLESSFLTEHDKAEFQVRFQTAPDASFTESEGRLAAMLASIRDIPEIRRTYATIGAGENGTVRDGLLYLKLTEKGERRKTQAELQREVRQRFQQVAGITFSIEEVGKVASSVKPLNVNVKGADVAVLKDIAARLKAKAYGIPGIVDVSVTLEHDIPEYRLRVDRERALSAGLSSGDVASALTKLVGGEVVTTYEDEDGDAVDVRVRLPEGLRQSPEQVRNLKIAIPDGAGGRRLVPLAAVTTSFVADTPSEVNRRDLERLVTVAANLDGLPLGTAVKKVEEAAKGIALPPGYSISFSGEAEDMAESFGFMAESLILAVVFVYLILAAQFESFLEPFAIMLSLPLSVVGMAGMLHLTGDTVNIMSLIGLIMLMGLVTKNAILLVDYAKVLQERDGLARRDAVVEAGRTRLRPIVMTTLAMIFGMLPLFFALGSGAEMRAPMARAVVGGLITSSLLTLLVVPVMYTYMDDLARWLKRKWTGKEGLPDAAKVTALLLAFLLAGGGVARAGEGRLLSLEEAFALADIRNHEIRKSREFRELVRGKYVEERAAVFPEVRVSAGALRLSDEIQRDLSRGLMPERQDVLSSTVEVSQPLFTWGKLGAAVRAAEMGFGTAEERHRLARQDARRDAAVAFYNILLARERETIARKNLAQKERHHDEASRKLLAGVATDYDVLAAKVAVDNARPAVVKAENQVRMARDQLRYVLAVEEDVDARGSLEPGTAPLPSFAEAMAEARQFRPELRELAQRRAIYDELVKIANAEDKPRLDFKGSYGWQDLDTSLENVGGEVWNAGVFMTFPLFDGLKARGKVAQAESERRAADIELEKAGEVVALEIRNALHIAAEAEAIMTALGGTVTQAERLLALAEKGFQHGVKVRLEVEDAEQNFREARLGLAGAKRDYLVALVELARVMGVLGEDEQSPGKDLDETP